MYFIDYEDNVSVLITSVVSVGVVFEGVEFEADNLREFVAENGRDSGVETDILVCSLFCLDVCDHYVHGLVGVYIPVGDGDTGIAIYRCVGLYLGRAVGEEVEFAGVWPVVGTGGVFPAAVNIGDGGVFDEGFGFGVVCSPGFAVFKIEGAGDEWSVERVCFGGFGLGVLHNVVADLRPGLLLRLYPCAGEREQNRCKSCQYCCMFCPEFHLGVVYWDPSGRSSPGG